METEYGKGCRSNLMSNCGANGRVRIVYEKQSTGTEFPTEDVRVLLFSVNY